LGNASDQTPTEQALLGRLRKSYHTNKQLYAANHALNSKDHHARIKDGGLLGVGYSQVELEEIERQVREQESLLQGYKQENEFIADKMHNADDNMEQYYTDIDELDDPSLGLAFNTKQGSTLPFDPPDLETGQAHDTASGKIELPQSKGSYIEDAGEMLAQISVRLTMLDQPIRDVYLAWSNRNRELLTVEQLLQGLLTIGLVCPIEILSSLINSFDSYGQGYLRFGDFNKLVNQGYIISQMRQSGVVDRSKLSDAVIKFQREIRNMRLRHPDSQIMLNSERLEDESIEAWASRPDPDSIRRSQHVIAHVDRDGDNKIDVHEFMRVWPGSKRSATQRFREIDTNHSGYISRKELATAIQKEKGVSMKRRNSVRLTTDSIKRAQNVVDRVDDNNDGYIDENDFLAVWPGSRQSGIRKFREIDRGADGLITARDLALVIQKDKAAMGKQSGRKDRLFDRADTNHDGVVSRDEYKRAISRGLISPRTSSARVCFDAADRNHNGVLERAEFRNALRDTPPPHTPHSCSRSRSSRRPNLIGRTKVIRPEADFDCIDTNRLMVQAQPEDDYVREAYHSLCNQLNVEIDQRDAEIRRCMAGQQIAANPTSISYQPVGYTSHNPTSSSYQPVGYTSSPAARQEVDNLHAKVSEAAESVRDLQHDIRMLMDDKDLEDKKFIHEVNNHFEDRMTQEHNSTRQSMIQMYRSELSELLTEAVEWSPHGRSAAKYHTYNPSQYA